MPIMIETNPLLPSARRLLVVATTVLLGANCALADTERRLEEVLVIGSATDLQSTAGSAAIIDAEALERHDYVDLGKVLSEVPGVYVRGEDGYGLRPNIGIRGAAAERSQKITLMKDGVLITPAPYSAPAAYYVPNVARISSIEVVKGPASTQYGPHTVGGAINFITSQPPEARQSRLDISAGSDGYHKLQLSHGDSLGDFGFLVDVLDYGADGFKELDGGGDTGFSRQDVGLKLTYAPSGSRFEQLVTLSLEMGDEEADETYLGLTDRDLVQNPRRRYRASRLDRFESEHQSLIVNYGLSLSDSLSINAKAYQTEFERSWNKLDGFEQGAPLQDVLNAPQNYALEYFILTGELDGTTDPSQLLDVTNNDRSYETSGVQLGANYAFSLEGVDVEVKAGVRAHHDEVSRLHSPISYQMVGGELQAFNMTRLPKTDNRAQTDAIASYTSVQLSRGPWATVLGVRHEDIDGEVLNRATGLVRDSNQSVVTPSLSVSWSPSDNLTAFVGVHEGFSPAGPGAASSPEESLNAEVGIRWMADALRAEAVAFYSDYENLIARCRVSDANCQPGEEFNGGEVEITGVEMMIAREWSLFSDIQLALNATYTYTDTAFQTSFLSGYNAWGLVRQNDELPYVPEHIGRITATLTRDAFTLDASVRMQSKMREVAGQGRLEDALYADGFSILDVSGSYQANDQLKLQLTVNNVTDESPIVSHRPFGARPEQPRSFIGRVVYEF